MPSGISSGKVWGKTKCVVETPFTEVHHIHVNKGGTCSKHCHQQKINGFYVISGKLLIRAWKKSYNLTDETILCAGDYTEIQPNEYHQFVALEDTEAIEIYMPLPIHNDIVRESIGSANPENTQILMEKL